MCLATVQKSDDTVVCRNVSRIDVDGEKVIIRDIMPLRQMRMQSRVRFHGRHR